MSYYYSPAKFTGKISKFPKTESSLNLSLDFGVKRQEYGLTGIESSELFKNVSDKCYSTQAQKYLIIVFVLLILGILAFKK